MNNLFKLSFLFIFAALSMILGSCTSGVDVDAVLYNSDQVVNYGKMVADGKIPQAALVYGQLMPGDNAERGGQILSAEQADLMSDINRLNNLLSDSDTNKAAYTTCIGNLQVNVQKLGPGIAKARESAWNAKDLVQQVEPEVKTGGTVETGLAACKALVPPSSVADYDAMAKSFSESFGRVYQIAVVLSQSIAQADAGKAVQKALGALQALEKNVADATYFTTPASRNTAQTSVLAAMSQIQGVRTYVDQMVRRLKIAPALQTATVSFVNAVTNLNASYLNNVAASVKPAAQSLYDVVKDASTELDKLSASYANAANGLEMVKDMRADAKLDDLIDKAFAGSVPVILGNLEIDKDTSINDLSRVLAQSKDNVVMMKLDDSSQLMVDALASSVYYKVAANYGLSADNVVGPANLVILKLKDELDLTNEKFADFTVSRAKKIRDDRSFAGKYKNLYIIFADDLERQGGDIRGMVNAFKADGGKVLLFTSNVDRYANIGTVYHAKDMDISAAILTANAVLEQYKDLPVAATRVSEPLVRIAAAFGGHLRLGEVVSLAKSAANRVMSLKSPSVSEVDDSVLATMTEYDRTINEALVMSSGVLSDDLSSLRSNLKSSRTYYVSMGAGGSGASSATQRELAERRALEDLALKRIEEGRIKNEIASALNAFDVAMLDLKNEFKTKESARRVTINDVLNTIDDKSIEVSVRIDAIKNMADDCWIDSTDRMTINAKFPVADREALAATDFTVPLPLNSYSDKAVKGTPDFAVAAGNFSKISCLLKNQADATALKSVLDEPRVAIEREMHSLKFKVMQCFNTVKGENECLANALDVYKHFRNKIANSKNESLIMKITDKVPVIPNTDAPFIGPRDTFWLGTGGVGVSINLLGGAHAFWHYLDTKNLGATASLHRAYSTLNQHGYIKAGLDIVGTVEDMAFLSSGIGKSSVIKLMSTTPLMTPIEKSRHILLAKLADGFDNSQASMVVPVKFLEKNYGVIVAGELASFVYENLVLELYNKAVKPFWTLKPQELKLFEDNSGSTPEGIERRKIWDGFVSLTNIINDIADDFNKPLLAPISDGDTAQSSGELKSLLQHYADLRDKVLEIEQLLIGTPGNALSGLDPVLVNKLNNVKTWLVSFHNSTFPGVALEDPTLGTAYINLPAPGALGSKFAELFENAYRLKKFNYYVADAKANGSIGVSKGNPARNYPIWHSKYSAAGALIEHPLVK